MRREAQVEWVCDRCGLEFFAPASKSGPDEWRVMFSPQLSRRSDIGGMQWDDLCSKCVESFSKWRKGVN